MPIHPEKPLLRLAHLSDLHFWKLVWSPSQFFSKRWIGNVNLLFKRKHTFAPDSLTTLIPLFREHKIDAVLITGDLSSTSHPEEFALAKQFISELEQQQLKVFVLPGNHDQYTKSAYQKKIFYQFFNPCYSTAQDPLSALNLAKDGLATAYFGNGWWLIGLDTAVATPLLSSQGHFSPELEQKLEVALKEIPYDHHVILINHFPLFSNESFRKTLIRKEALRKLIERFPKVKLYLHGHTHRHTLADLRSSHLPIILDSGSASQKQGGTWNLIDITKQGCEIEVFKNLSKTHSPEWHPVLRSGFKW
jgi:3',5'-cyclic AMP phosphodiesterase CpdA